MVNTEEAELCHEIDLNECSQQVRITMARVSEAPAHFNRFDQDVRRDEYEL